MAKIKSNTTNAAAGNPEPRFSLSQLIGCKAIKASPDVIRAVLGAEKLYTIAEAKAAINEFLNRKV